MHNGNLYRFTKTDDVSNNDALRYAFQPTFSLPAEDIMGFSQYRVQRSFRAFQPPQVHVKQGSLTAGLGGVISGNMALQGLLVPSAQLP